jgi:MtfA peptidase
MDTIFILLFVVGILMVLLSLFTMQKNKRRKYVLQPFPGSWRIILSEQVDFYNQLSDDKKIEFENRMLHFLAGLRITGVNTTVDDTDRILIAASAIIPIFGFPDWEYINLREVLLYPDSFNHEFEQKGAGRNTLGMVGDGPYQQIMILSKHELHQGFINKTGKSNTAIHEFIHLVDKTDGSVDGIPEFLVARKYVLPWLELMQKEIKRIMANRSDINPYGATNQAEFFAVVTEYFFERPDLLHTKHPELYDLLVTIFRQEPRYKGR